MLIDYSSLLYRAFHSVPDTVAMHGVYGFLNMLARLLGDHRPTGLAIAVDDDWRPAFRVEALPSYKAHRVADAEDPADPVAPQEAVGREVLRALGFAAARVGELAEAAAAWRGCAHEDDGDEALREAIEAVERLRELLEAHATV